MDKKSPIVIAVSGRIRARREMLKYSQEGFADHIGMDRKNYGSIERGERNISITNLIKIANGLNVEIGELFPPIKELKELLKRIKK